MSSGLLASRPVDSHNTNCWFGKMDTPMLLDFLEDDDAFETIMEDILSYSEEEEEEEEEEDLELRDDMINSQATINFSNKLTTVRKSCKCAECLFIMRRCYVKRTEQCHYS